MKGRRKKRTREESDNSSVICSKSANSQVNKPPNIGLT